ncbi:MAG TPA: CHAT domain-containing tetratricopeptide repeat protein [Gemmatimonadaceae bacterium]
MHVAAARRVCWLLLAVGCSVAEDSTSKLPLSGAALRVDSLVRLGDSTYRQDYDSARRLWQRAVDEATPIDDSVSIARALTGIGMSARQSGDHADSRRFGEQALAIKQRLGMGPRDLFRSYNALGLLAWTTERLGDASDLFARASDAARAANDSIALGMVTVNTGLVAKDLGAFDRSRAALEQGRDIARSQGDSVTLGRALNNLAMLDIALGDPISAIASIEEARRLARSTGDSINEVNARGQLATAYRALGEPQRAFALLDSALTMAQRSGQRQEVAEDLTLIGDLFFEAGDHQHALDYYRRALVATDSLEQPEERGNILRSEARAHAALGNFVLALQRAGESLRIHREGGFTYPELSDLIVLADLAQQNGQGAVAEAHLRSAQRIATDLDAPIAAAQVAIATAGVAALARQWDRVLQAIERGRGILYLAGSTAEADAWTLQAHALAELGRNEAALAAGRRAIDAVEQIRGNYAAGELRTTYTSEKADVFAQQALLLLRLGRTSEAFEVADAARGRALLEHLAQARADIRDASGAGRLLEQEALLRRIDALLGQLREREQTPPRERSTDFVAATTNLRDSVDALRAEYTALVARNATTSAASQAVAGLARPAVGDIRRSLQRGEVLLEYLVTPERLLIFVVTPSSVTVHVSEERAAELTSRVQLARELLRRPGTDDESRGVLRALFEIVLGPVARAGTLQQAKRLIVVPHGVLTYLPFAALVEPESQKYLAEQHVLLHLPTSAALPALRGGVSVRSTTRSGAEIFAPVDAQLPATRGEAERVATVLRGASLYLGARATEGRLRQALQRGGIVHVATHATLNSRNPLFSYIELARDPRVTAGDNGRLEVHELLGLRLDSPLVFLSGCETAIGGSWSTRFDTGEDYATIGQTLLYAGARNVVATLWRIDDVGAAEFARQFYEALRGSGYAEAMAEAQRRLIADSRYRSPYFWAAYQVSGSGLADTAGANRADESDKRSGSGVGGR